MAETSPDMDNAESRLDINDRKLWKEIVEVLEVDGPQRVLLAGEAGIGKTRLAKKVGEYATTNTNSFCFMILWLDLNKKFGDEWSLYENIASQLSVYSDFEETEVDDRDEDEEEEKKADVLLDELKKKIIDEIVKKTNLADKKIEDEAERKKKEEAEKANKGVKKLKETGNKNEKTTQVEKTPPAAGDASSTRKPYLLLILDDEGNKTSENVVMKDLKLEKFLKDEILKEDTRLKVLVTRRKGDEEPKKPARETESQDKKSEQGDEEEEDAKSVQKDEDEEDVKNDQGDEVEEDAKSDSKTESPGEIESQDKDNDEETKAQATSSPQITEQEGESVPPTGAESKVQTKCCFDTIDFQITDKSEALLNSINEPNLKDLFVSLITDWKPYEDFIHEIVEKIKNSPAAIVVLVKSLKWITRSTSNPGEVELKKKLDEVLSTDRSDPSDPGSSSESAINPIMYLAYELLETYGPLKDAILDCFWH